MDSLIYFCVVFLLNCHQIYGGADHEVERVRSPFVDLRDLGPLMSVNKNKKEIVVNDVPSSEPYVPFNAYPNFGQQKRVCTTCQYGTSSSSASSSSSSMGGIPHRGNVYGSPGSYGYLEPSVPVHASSRHEVKKEQEFVNGQKVYDFHHEKRYKDGKLIDEQRHEVAPETLNSPSGPQQPGFRPSVNYGSSSSSNALVSSQNMFGSHSPYYGESLPSQSISKEKESQYQEVTHSGYGTDNSHLYENQFNDEFQSEIERMHEEMRRNTLSLSPATRPIYGGSHKTEYRTQTKYVNGKPVYIRNEERKYKDGKLVHNVTDEKGPEDLGTADLSLNTPYLSAPSGGVYSSHQEVVSKHSQVPVPAYNYRYPGSYPSYYSSNAKSASSTLRQQQQQPYQNSLSAEDYLTSSYYPSSSSSFQSEHSNVGSSNTRSSYSSNQQPSYSHSPMYSPETPEYRQQAHSSSSYHTNTYGTAHGEGGESNINSYHPDTYESSQYDNYDRTSHHRKYDAPTTTSTSTTTTTTTTPRPIYEPLDYASEHEHRSETAYHSRPITTFNQVNYHDTSSRQNYKTPVPSYYRSRGETYKNSEDNIYEDSRYQTYKPVVHVSTEATPLVPISRVGEPYEVKYVRPSTSNTFSQSEDKIREVSQSSYYDANPNRRHPERYPGYLQSTNQVQRVHQDDNDYKFNSNVHETSSFTETQGNKRFHTPSDTQKVTQTSNNYPDVRVSSSVTQEERKHRISSGYYPQLRKTPEIGVSQVSQQSYTSRRDDEYDDDEVENTLTRRPEVVEAAHSPKDIATTTRSPEMYAPTRRPDRFTQPDYYKHPDTVNSVGVPGVILGPMLNRRLGKEGEQERYDISPYDDDTTDLNSEDEFETNEFSHEHLPQHKTEPKPYIPSYGASSSHSYEESRRLETEHSKQEMPKRVLNNDKSLYNQQHGYAVVNSTRTDHKTTTILPSKWVDTRTVWNYVNGILSSEIQYHKYYENGILIHENSTKRTRDQMATAGINVLNLDLTSTELAQYGPAITSTTHTQKHEVHQIKRFRDGQQTYELNEERLFQDGDLVHENKEEKDEDDFGIVDTTGRNLNHHLTQSQHLNQHSVTSGNELLTGISVNPKTYVRRHELRQEEEFVNGQKVYNLHHEKEYHDGSLIRENKTELGPDDLRLHNNGHQDALKNILVGNTFDSLSHEALSRQKVDADNILTTSCISCGTHGVSGSSSSFTQVNQENSGGILGSLIIPTELVHGDGSTFRHDINVEEHYENGKLVKGREVHKKWQDGQLIDSDLETYFGGPSRAEKVSSQTSVGSSYEEFSSPAEIKVSKGIDDKCEYNPCLNSGKCRTTIRGPVCVCGFGFRGTHCEDAYCPSRFCRYGGTCTIFNGQQQCACTEGYSGHRCTTRVHKIKLGTRG